MMSFSFFFSLFSSLLFFTHVAFFCYFSPHPFTNPNQPPPRTFHLTSKFLLFTLSKPPWRTATFLLYFTFFLEIFLFVFIYIFYIIFPSLTPSLGLFLLLFCIYFFFLFFHPFTRILIFFFLFFFPLPNSIQVSLLLACGSRRY